MLLLNQKFDWQPLLCKSEDVNTKDYRINNWKLCYSRQWSESLTDWAMFGATFNLVTRRTTVIFLKTQLKYGSLQINSLAQTIFSTTETTSKMALTFCQNKVKHFLSKSSKFCIVWTVGFCSNFNSMWETLEFQYQHIPNWIQTQIVRD